MPILSSFPPHLPQRYLTLSEPVDKKAKLETETSEGDEPGGKIARGNEDSNDQVVPPSLEQPRSAHDIYKQQTKVLIGHFIKLL